MRMAPIFLGNNLQLGAYANSIGPNSFVAMVFFLPQFWEHPQPRQPEMEQMQIMTTGCQSTLSRKARRRAKANTKIRTVFAQATQMSTLARTVVELDMSERLLETRWRGHTTTPTTTQTEARTTRKTRAKANRWTWCKRGRLPKQPQPRRIPHRHRARLTLCGAIPTCNRMGGL